MDRSFVSQPFSPGALDDAATSELLGRRLGRVAGGGVLALGPALVLAQYVVVHEVLHLRSSVLSTAPLIAMLWIAAAVVAVAARRFGRSRAALGLWDREAFGRASFIVPAIGVALAGPLSLHALVGLPIWLAGVVGGENDLRDGFDGWVALSVVGTAHVHLFFAVAMVGAVGKLMRGDAVERVSLWPSVVASLLPGIVLAFPPVLVFVTGHAVSRLFLRRARRWVVDDAVADGRPGEAAPR